MRTNATRVMSAVAAAGALSALVLLGIGAGAMAAPASSGRGQTTAAVPANFEPVSASFWSPAHGVALGGVGCAGGNACTARLAVTADGGAHWRFLTAPSVRLFNIAGNSLTQSSAVRGVVFADRLDGWLYGPGLYATHDGGAHWSRIFLGGDIIPSLGGGVATMAASSGSTYAVVSPDPFHGKPDELYKSPAGRNAWARVGRMTATLATFATSGRAAWFASGSGFSAPATHLWATADGLHWHQYPFACPGSYGLQSIAAASPSHLVFLCTGESFTGHTAKEVLLSANGGKTEHLVGPAPLAGVGGVIAVPPRGSAVITLAAEYFLYRSADGGKTWKTVLFYSGGATWSSLSYVSGTVGSVVVSSGGQWLLRTTDVGLTWHRIAFCGRSRSSRPS
jgi:photosystem II stability/assembly factor-like uncharacterized protein